MNLIYNNINTIELYLQATLSSLQELESIIHANRFFEGNAQDMYKNFKLISSFPDDTFIFCGHEYTVQNLKWST
jgi:hypothetical protein